MAEKMLVYLRKVMGNWLSVTCVPDEIRKVSNTNVKVESYFALLDRVTRDSSSNSISSRSNIVSAKMNNLFQFLRNLDNITNNWILLKSYRGSKELVIYRQKRELELQNEFKLSEGLKADKVRIKMFVCVFKFKF